MVNHPGNILIAPYVSESELDSILDGVERVVHSDFLEQQEKNEQAKKESEKNNTNLILWIVVIPAIIGFVSWLISMSYLW